MSPNLPDISRDVIVMLEQLGTEFFCDSSKKAFASFKNKERLETLPIESSQFASFVNAAYYQSHKTALSKHSLEKCMNVCKAKALYDGKQEEVYLRVASIVDGLELDLNNPDGECVKITGTGWEITKPTTKFYRPEGSLPLVRPERSGDINLIWKYLNAAPDDRILMLGWLLSAFNPKGPYPLLIIQGEQNCAKSTTMSNLRALIDPARADRAGMVKDVREVFTSATRNWIMSFDNLQGLSNDISDAFCRLATGGALRERKLYANGEEFVIEAARPVILNGIEDIASRPDLESRSIILNLPKLKERKDVRVMETQFEEDKPRILGALMDALAHSVKSMQIAHNHPKLRFPSVLGWVYQAEEFLGFKKGDFEAAWEINQIQAKVQNIDLDPVARGIIDFMRQHPKDSWTGSATDLLQRLEVELAENKRKPATWPKSPRGFSGHLSRIADNLAEIGLEYDKHQRQGNLRPITLTKTEKFLELTVMFVTTEKAEKYEQVPFE